jgi:hypothetical protein
MAEGDTRRIAISVCGHLLLIACKRVDSVALRDRGWFQWVPENDLIQRCGGVPGTAGTARLLTEIA